VVERSSEGSGVTFAEQVALAPEGPGVYLLKDAKGRVLYVGKARVLRERLRAYTQPQENRRLAALVARVRALETVVTRSEVEALVLEENFIKMKKPRYNVRLRDDKKFPYLKLTLGEPYPRILVTRNLVQDGSAWFGPYTSARELRKALRGVKRIFRLRTCRYDLPGDRPARPCLEFEVNRCTGPCGDRVTREEYRQQADDTARFLAGRADELVQGIEERMWQASRAQEFEAAGLLRDQLLALREIRKEQQAVLRDKASRDVVALARAGGAAVGTLLRIREGKVVAREEYPLAAAADAPDSELLATVIRAAHLHTADLPDEILLPAPIDEAAALEALFAERRGRKVRFVVPARGEKVGLLELARANAEKALVELGPRERVPAGGRELGELLGLAAPPRRIEGVDISNTQGTNAVGSVVVFRDDRPRKQGYRLFRVRTVKGANDFAMMEEVLSRRARGLVERGEPLPDLVLVDGGKGQLAAAMRAYHSVQPGIPILGIAKRTDRLYYADGREFSVPLRSPALGLLKRVRDESHRFAITYHRKLRGKGMVESELDAIRGLGPARKRALIRHFGSLESAKSASAADIARVKGFGPALAASVYAALSR
jgi:excinuclease ABC subunit C